MIEEEEESTKKDKPVKEYFVDTFHSCIGVKNKDDVVVVVAVIFVSFGLALMCTGYIIPRDYKFDPSLPAREMERIEIHYANLAYYLNVSSVVGMGFITVGAVVISGLTVYKYMTSKDKIYRKEDRQDLNLLEEPHFEMTTYGTTNGEK